MESSRILATSPGKDISQKEGGAPTDLLLERDDEAGPSLLFVYGTLRRGYNHPMARLLALHARYLGPGRLQGRLYRPGRYPGAIFSQRPGDWVQGDLYQMKAAARLLTRLDRYEGLDSGRKRLSEYHRVIASIHGDDGRTQSAWVYRYRLPVNRLKRLVSGDFLRQRRAAGQQLPRYPEVEGAFSGLRLERALPPESHEDGYRGRGGTAGWGQGGVWSL